MRLADCNHVRARLPRDLSVPMATSSVIAIVGMSERIGRSNRLLGFEPRGVCGGSEPEVLRV